MPSPARVVDRAARAAVDRSVRRDEVDTEALLNVRTSSMVSQVTLHHFRPEALAAVLRKRPGAPLHKQLETVIRDLVESGQAQPGCSCPVSWNLPLNWASVATPFATRWVC